MAAKKSKSKAWFTIISPDIFGKKIIGKTMVSDPKHLVGRKINTSAVEVTDNFSKYYMKFSFRISGTEDGKAYTDFDGSECMRDYISRMVVRHVRRIDMVHDLKTKDGVDIRVKGLAILSRRATSSTLKVLRKRMSEMIEGIVKENDMGGLIDGILSDKMKGHILREVRTIYPVRNFEFRKIEVLRKQSN